MSTIDHITAECGRLRAAWGWLAEAVTPGRSRRNQRALTDADRTRRDRQARAERNDRAKLLTAGKLLAGTTRAPANLDAIDTREKVAQQVDDTAWQLASHLRNRVQPPYRAGQPAYRPNSTNADTRFRTAIDWVSLNAARLGPDDQQVINTTYRTLVDATTAATTAAGAGPALRPLAAECPACGRRSLRWDTTSPEPAEWAIHCVNQQCRCDGRNCACGLPERQHGMTHLWSEAGWERLAQQLDARNPA